MAEVARLLTLSHGAHLEYRQAVLIPDASEARAALLRAQDFRTQAIALDPDLTAPAWQAEAAKYPHAELLLFYAVELLK